LGLRHENETAQTNVMGAIAKHPHRRNGTQRQLTTLFGEVLVTRLGYSSKEAGVSAFYPSEGQLNLPPDQYSDGIRSRVATTASLVSFSETSQTIGETTGSEVVISMNIGNFIKPRNSNVTMSASFRNLNGFWLPNYITSKEPHPNWIGTLCWNVIQTVRWLDD
jgi:hypothetical protein